MSDRTGDYRHPFWNSRDQRIRADYLAALKAKGRIDELNSELARRQRAEYLESCVAELRGEKAQLVAELSASMALGKDRWTQRLEAIELTGASAIDELETLREDVARRRTLLRGTTAPQSRERPTEVLLIRFQLEADEREARFREAAAELDHIVAALASLIDSVRRYAAARG